MKRIIVLLAIFVVIFTNISINTSAATTNKYTDGIGVVQVNKKVKSSC